ncbi:MAG: hypothetical protein RLZZ182_895, partial [Pseudomonadota bacterium]
LAGAAALADAAEAGDADVGRYSAPF